MEPARSNECAEGISPLADGLPALTYSQSSGLMIAADGSFVAQGWAGNGAGKNNPAMQNIHDVGPLPQGLYRVGEWGSHPPLGDHSAILTQVEGETFGRSGFYIHGPSQSHWGQESKGCIVIPHDQRLAVEALKPGFVRVVG